MEYKKNGQTKNGFFLPQSVKTKNNGVLKPVHNRTGTFQQFFLIILPYIHYEMRLNLHGILKNTRITSRYGR